MSFLKEFTDKGATIAWSKAAAHPSLVALGTKVRLSSGESFNFHPTRRGWGAGSHDAVIPECSGICCSACRPRDGRTMAPLSFVAVAVCCLSMLPSLPGT